MNNVIAMSQAVSGRFLRFSLGFVLFWIGALKFADPGPVVGLLNASIPFVAFTGVVYCLGLAKASRALRLSKAPFISSGVVSVPEQQLGFDKGFLVRDPDGHVIELSER